MIVNTDNALSKWVFYFRQIKMYDLLETFFSRVINLLDASYTEAELRYREKYNIWT